ncbi:MULTISPECIES: UDP-N-acetylmuramoyl-L-alanyl-D-glutamate--2,6-diaminopimelate ligase [Robiginitalea]|uniref:UDP-N-acetylmuramoyl-L-alanyl-D-glutamate--2,6-diaminopimelate ligase n=1 Tax=Robiginitalea biformata (strain ATCC BAA-864 / DSM 15991 / KCTC 12146 / HTCC2501) TaxID=313596 RepID=A4CPL3_ROBBH|nr:MULTISPECIES: UDP-N-acetylmuramoyl-L-alanyl-D-glutamate--2,6-diaminopimelate ligase [Robiginitalea]EAR14334.1 UDP-N-acetylmuramoylalanyl-D-glutamate--2,6-diaminopimelate ligase [Robiginitalea biformata HTCC2501]MDC6354579.1 UDP-N-acetylmuramoyl-L-alanyl-D-glutamate--2,6-diaminopimelate ligase [Robiginitalea sp. PM2]MDC6374739.1 UDP-N-acetylmuramoyl-L-alanyl-D-glutamate--2,6-diaminopimelate ligase [Robiginitalea sp. SP8]
MKQLKDLLFGVSLHAVSGSTAVGIESIRFDSRETGASDAFVAIRGTEADGHRFIDGAVKNGVRAVICEELPQDLADGVTYVEVADTQLALAVMASNYYGNPSANLRLVGVTGTNGKTTVSTLLYQLFKKAGYKVGLISTIKIMVDDQEFPTRLTTPDSLTINKYLSRMNEAGVEFCFMEVSSHGIAQRRTEGLVFEGGIFTNLSHDHLDYHKDFADYRDTKKKLFDGLPKSAFALTNADDKNGLFMIQNTRARKLTYALRSYADFRAQILEQQLDGQLLKIQDNEVWTKLIGQFNAYNLLAIYATASLLGLGQLEILQLLSGLQTVDGRFQYFVSKQRITAIVDYAHTPDALKNVLVTINALRTGNESVITVVGCGGERDKSKRPVMGHIASDMSETAIFTSDNPRREPPRDIIAEMEAGVEPQNVRKVLVIEDREQAIRTACKMAGGGDIILIAGKGHETYQEIAGVRRDFDDYKLVSEVLERLASEV